MLSNSRRVAAALALVAVGPLLAGCGDDCEDYCEDAKSCAHADSDLAGADCVEECQQAEDLADAADCSDAFDDFISCARDGDVCKATEECKTEALAFAFCGLIYCQGNKDAPECKGAVCTTSSSASGTSSCSVSRSCQGEAEVSLSCNETECTCAQSQATVKTVPKDPAFCDSSTAGDAAAAACGW